MDRTCTVADIMARSCENSIKGDLLQQGEMEVVVYWREKACQVPFLPYKILLLLHKALNVFK